MQSLSQAEHESFIQIRQWYNKAARLAALTCPVPCSWSPHRSATSKTSPRVRCASSAKSPLIAAEDTRRTHHLLSRYAIATPTTSLHEHNEGRKLAALVERLRAGRARGARVGRGHAHHLRSGTTTDSRGNRRRTAGRAHTWPERRRFSNRRLRNRRPVVHVPRISTNSVKRPQECGWRN